MKSKMKSILKWSIIILILGGISFGLYRFANPPKPELPMDNAGAITFPVTKETLVNHIEVKGKSSYEKETIVYAPFGAEVKQWAVKDGQQLKKGDLIFRLEPIALVNDIAQAEATIKKQQLETQLAQYQSALSEEDQALPSTEAEMKKKFAEKETTKLQQELNNVTIDIQRKEIAQKQKKVDAANYFAPSPGIFLYDDPNKIPQALKENDRVGKIVDLKKLQLVTLVGEQDVFRIKPGMAVEVKMNAMKNVKIKGKVLKVSKFAKAVSAEQSNNNQPAQFEVIIGLDVNENLIAGLSLTGQIETQRKENAIVVPTVAVMREKESVFVMIDKGNGQVERKEIKVGLETSEKTEVLEGLKEGDTVMLQ